MQGSLHFTLFGFACLLMLVTAATQDGETGKSLKSKATEVEDMVNIVVKIYLNKDLIGCPIEVWLSVSNGGGGCDGVGNVEHD